MRKELVVNERLDRAKELRDNPTDAEAFAWQQLRNRRFANFKFRRQAPLGPYILDFVCFQYRVVVELDGGQHNEPAQKLHDARRAEWLKSQGFQVLRFWNHEILTEWNVVEEAIWRALQSAPSPGR